MYSTEKPVYVKPGQTSIDTSYQGNIIGIYRWLLPLWQNHSLFCFFSLAFISKCLPVLHEKNSMLSIATTAWVRSWMDCQVMVAILVVYASATLIWQSNECPMVVSDFDLAVISVQSPWNYVFLQSDVIFQFWNKKILIFKLKLLMVAVRIGTAHASILRRHTFIYNSFWII